MTPKRVLSTLCVFAALCSPKVVTAQTFPSDYKTITCDGMASTDDLVDENQGQLNIVGEAGTPAYYYQTDGEFIYFRMRVDESPIGMGGQGKFQQFSWSFGVDTDGNTANGYEVLIILDGLNEVVKVVDFTAPDPDFEYSTATHAKVDQAGTSLNGTTDYFIEVAVPFADLNSLGVTGEMVIWGGSASNSSGDQKDLVCFNGTPGTLAEVPVDPVLVPTVCSMSDECPMVEPVCDTQSGLCVQCIVGGDCTGGQACVSNQCVAAGCGDGNVDNGESCDDGDADDTNACNNSCKVNTGFMMCLAAVDCADPDASCVGGTCVLQVGESLCTSDAGCEGNVSCGPSGVCGETGASCSANDQCLGTCIAGSCAVTSGLGGDCDTLDDDDCTGAVNCNAAGICGGDTAVCAQPDECVSGNCAALVCAPSVLCGNGSIDGDEACDDGDNDDTNDCNNSCKLNLGASGCNDDSDCVGDIGCGEGGVCGANTALCASNDQCVETCIGATCAAPPDVGGTCDAGENDDCAGAIACSSNGICGGDGAVCSTNLQCTNTCVSNTCATRSDPGGSCDVGDAADCSANVDCDANGVCGGNGADCTDNVQCVVTCLAGTCADEASAGEACDAGDNDDCVDMDAVCNQSTCQFPDGTGSCTGDNQTQVCISGMCAAGICDGTCGDSTLDDGEACDAGGANGPYPAVCSVRCRFNAGQACADSATCEEGLVCSVTSSCTQDRDADGVADTDDLDDDNDGIADVDESDGNDPSQDSDSDGLLDFQDPDAEGFVDANSDGTDDRYDFDSDGVPNHLDLDSDADTVFDLVEGGGKDEDGDGRVDSCVDENANGSCDMLEAVPLPLPNTDGADGPDFLDPDDDNDGISTLLEVTDAAVYGTDVDTDGVPNWLDLDSDGDGESDMDEGRGDDDSDGIPNYLDADMVSMPDGGMVMDGGVPDAIVTPDGSSPGTGGGKLPRFDGEVSGGALGCAVSPLRGAGGLLVLVLAVGLIVRRRRG